MRIRIVSAAGLCASAMAGAAVAADNEAGVPLSPSEAAGTWTLESAGHRICEVTLSATKSGQGYGAKADPACAQTLGGAASGWEPSRGGMRLVTADGAPLLGFSRWSNSLFVSHPSSGVDVQLRRGQ